VRREIAGRQVVVVVVDDLLIDVAIVPDEFLVVDQIGERVGAGGVDDGHARDAVDQAELLEFAKGLAEGAGVAQVAAGDDDPVGNLPAEALDDTIHDGMVWAP